jgi:hypothetical protein
VYQFRALQGVVGPFGSEVAVSQAPQFFVDQRHESAQSFYVALLPCMQELRDLACLIIGHGYWLPPFRRGPPAYSGR